MERSNKFLVPLTPTTAELIERYADFDSEGYIAKFQIINEELIGALDSASRWLSEGFASNERLSEVWERENPCADCAEREGCTITCRRKHSFDKEVYGGLLCGTNPAAYQLKWGSQTTVANNVHFRVRLENKNTLSFERDATPLSGAIKVTKKSSIVRIEGKVVKLRPWSAALYAMFTLHPEGFALSSLANEHRKEFIKIYADISKSRIKVERLVAGLDDTKHLSHLLNNKLSELNAQLSEANIAPIYRIRTESHKANNKPYYIPYLRD